MDGQAEAGSQVVFFYLIHLIPTNTGDFKRRVRMRVYILQHSEKDVYILRMLERLPSSKENL